MLPRTGAIVELTATGNTNPSQKQHGSIATLFMVTSIDSYFSMMMIDFKASEKGTYSWCSTHCFGTLFNVVLMILKSLWEAWCCELSLQRNTTGRLTKSLAATRLYLCVLTFLASERSVYIKWPGPVQGLTDPNYLMLLWNWEAEVGSLSLKQIFSYYRCAGSCCVCRTLVGAWV